MKKTLVGTVVKLVAIVALFAPTFSQAQTSQQFNGTGTWDQGVTPDWNTGVWNGGYNDAVFAGSDSATVSGTVTFDQIDFFNGGSGTTISGPGTLAVNPFDGSNANPGSSFFIFDNSTSPVTILAPIELSDMGANNGTNGYIFDGQSSLTIGNIDWGSYTLNPSLNSMQNVDNNGALRVVNLITNSATASVTLNGTYTNENYANNGNTASQINMDDGGTGGSFTIAASANFANFVPGTSDVGAVNLNSGTLNIDNSTFAVGSWINVSGSPDNVHMINLVNSQTINSSMHENLKNNGATQASDGISIYGENTIQQSGAGSSTWAGQINQDGSNTTLGATTLNSRLTMSGDISGASPLGLIVGGSGIVVLSNPTGNDYNERDGNGNLQPTSTVAATLKSGTTLITNTSGSAFGGQYYNYGNFYGNQGYQTGVVNVNGGATLGGNGISTNPIIAVSGTSIIAPGDPGQAALSIAPSIGTLTLSGGIEADNGITLNFKIDGANNDSISLLGGDFAPSGDLTVNISTLGAGIITNHFYTLMTGQGNFDLIDGTTGGAPNVIAPYGYYVTGMTDTFGTFSVEFQAAPEPSTYALTLGGLGFLAFCLRCKGRV